MAAMRSSAVAFLPLSELITLAGFGSRLAPCDLSGLAAVGSHQLLQSERTALFCSAQTSGDSILRAHDTVRYLRDTERTVISGFHSPIEKECLKILLRGKQPIIICPARAIENMRIAKECRPAFDAGRILYLSPFTEKPRRVTRESAKRRNDLVAALADAAFIPHIAPNGETERIAGLLKKWHVPIARTAVDLRAMEQQRLRDLVQEGDGLHL